MHEIPQNQAATIEFVPPVIPASAVATVYDSAGTALVSGSCTVDSPNTTLSAVTSRTAVTVASATGIVPGRPYWLAAAGNTDVRTLVRVDSLTAAVLDIYPSAARLPAVGDTFRAARITFAVSATYTGTRDTKARVEWTVTDPAGVVTTYQQPLAIVRTVFGYAVRPEDVRARLAQRQGSRALEWDRDPSRYQSVAERAADLVRGRIRATERHEALCGDSDAFREAGRLALALVLVEEGVKDGIADVTTYSDALVRRLDDEVRRAIAACWFDADDDGAVASRETRPSWIPIRR